MNIYLGFAVYNRMVDIEIVTAIAQMIAKGNHTYGIDFVSGPYIAENRNRLAKRFLEHKDYEWLFFWDTDVAVKDYEFIDKLLETSQKLGAKVVSGCYRLKSNEDKYPITVDMTEENGVKYFKNLTSQELKEPMEVRTTATGLMLIHRSVLEKVETPWFTVIDYPTIGDILPDDFYFCLKAKDAGFKIAIDPRIATWHSAWAFWPHVPK